MGQSTSGYESSTDKDSDSRMAPAQMTTAQSSLQAWCTVQGTGDDIETWARGHGSFAPIDKEYTNESESVFALVLHQEAFTDRGFRDVVIGRLEVKAWSNSTADVRFVLQPVQDGLDVEQEGEYRRWKLGQTKTAFLNRFPYVDGQAAQPAEPSACGPAVNNISGGVNVDANNVTVGNDVVGHDKIIQYIEHATIIQP
jgi:hypothetical protein